MDVTEVQVVSYLNNYKLKVNTLELIIKLVISYVKIMDALHETKL